MSTHTPGPWIVGLPTRQNLSVALVSASSGAVSIYAAPLTEETAANARLIAAAPELLEACEQAQKELLGVSSYLDTCEPGVIVGNLDSIVASLRAKLAIVEGAISKAVVA